MFNDCMDAGGRATHGAVAEARKQAHGQPCNCLRNAEEGWKDKSVAGIIKFTFLSRFIDIAFASGQKLYDSGIAGLG